MIVNINNDPWKHLIIDDMLCTDDFNSVLQYVKSVYDFSTKTEGYVEAHRYDSDTIINKILSPIILELKDKYFDELNFGHKILPEKYYTFIEMVICPPMYNYKKIHTDNAYKLMSTVLYLYPEDADATDLYSNKDKESYHSTIEWKQNRAFSFVGQQKDDYQKTYHNYGNMRPFPRVTFNMLLTDNPNANY